MQNLHYTRQADRSRAVAIQEGEGRVSPAAHRSVVCPLFTTTKLTLSIGKALIVCPVSLCDNWRMEFRKWSARLCYSIIDRMS